MDAREKWNKLNAETQARLLDKYRDPLDHNWFEFLYECLRDDMAAIGVVVDGIGFSGFCSQGDGAYFAGHVDDAGAFLTAVGKPELKEFWEKHVDTQGTYRWEHRGRYCHDASVEFDPMGVLYAPNPFDEDDDPLRYAAWEAMYPYPVEGGPAYAARYDFADFLRGRMKKLYRDLEEEHDYLTSDGTTLEYILGDVILDEALAEQEAEEADA